MSENPLWPDDIDAPLWPDDIDAPSWDDHCCCDTEPCRCCYQLIVSGGTDVDGSYDLYWDGTKWTDGTNTLEYVAGVPTWRVTVTNGSCTLTFTATGTAPPACPPLDGAWTVEGNTCTGTPAMSIYTGVCAYNTCPTLCTFCEETYSFAIEAGSHDCGCVYNPGTDKWEHLEYTWSSQTITVTKTATECEWSGLLATSLRTRIYPGFPAAGCVEPPDSDVTTAPSVSVNVLCESTTWASYIILACIDAVYASTGAIDCCPPGTYTGSFTGVLT